MANLDSTFAARTGVLSGVYVGYDAIANLNSVDAAATGAGFYSEVASSATPIDSCSSSADLVTVGATDLVADGADDLAIGAAGIAIPIVDSAVGVADKDAPAGSYFGAADNSADVTPVDNSAGANLDDNSAGADLDDNSAGDNSTGMVAYDNFTGAIDLDADIAVVNCIGAIAAYTDPVVSATGIATTSADSVSATVIQSSTVAIDIYAGATELAAAVSATNLVTDCAAFAAQTHAVAGSAVVGSAKATDSVDLGADCVMTTQLFYPAGQTTMVAKSVQIATMAAELIMISVAVSAAKIAFTVTALAPTSSYPVSRSISYRNFPPLISQITLYDLIIFIPSHPFSSYPFALYLDDGHSFGIFGLVGSYPNPAFALYYNYFNSLSSDHRNSDSHGYYDTSCNYPFDPGY